MAANHRIRAILRLRHQGTISKRQADLLLALETFISPAGSWGEAGTGLIETETGIAARTIARARGELIAADWLDYERGDGRGHPSRYRVRLPHAPKKGGQNEDSKGGQNEDSDGDDLATFERWPTGPVKVATDPDKGGHRNPATSGNASGAVRTSAVNTSAARPPRLNGHAEGARSGQPADDDFLDYETRPRRSPGLGQCTVCGGWFVAAALGRVNHHTGRRPDGSYGTCPGAGQPPARPVRCTGCGRTGLGLAALTGLCAACTRERKEAEAEGRAWP